MSDKTLTDKTLIVTDGSCSGNPGPGGWAAIIRRKDQELIITGNDKQTTNNRMEMMAVIEAVSMLRANEAAIIQTDSKYIVDGVKSWMKKWKKNNWMTSSGRVKNVDLWVQMDNIINKHNLDFQWIRGHSTDLIDKADELAKEQTQKIKETL